MNKLKFKSIFISDAHLGSKGAQAEKLLDFLNKSTAEAIYLVGDIIDGWQLNKKWHWPDSHGKVLDKLIKLSEEGKKVIYVSGNHDDFLRKVGNFSMGGIKFCSEITHRTLKKKKYLYSFIIIKASPYSSKKALHKTFSIVMAIKRFKVVFTKIWKNNLISLKYLSKGKISNSNNFKTPNL